MPSLWLPCDPHLRGTGLDRIQAKKEERRRMERAIVAHRFEEQKLDGAKRARVSGGCGRSRPVA
jgi:hypothetical protein